MTPFGAASAVVVALLVAATVVAAVLSRARPEKDYTELKARIRSWWWMIALFLGSLWAGRAWAVSLLGLVSFWALKEYVTLLKTRPADHRALVWAFLAVPLQYYWIAREWYGMFIIFIPVWMFMWLPTRLMLAKDTAGFMVSASEIQWGLMAFVFGLSHAAGLMSLPGQDGRSLALFLVYVVALSDVLQYVWGKTLGRTKIIPTVSPNKTVEGFVGGVLSVSLASLLLRPLTPFTPLETSGVSLLVACAGFFGGAVMSAVKRDFGVKDFGATIPGHGGMADRVDSLCYAAPVFFHYVRYFHT